MPSIRGSAGGGRGLGRQQDCPSGPTGPSGERGRTEGCVAMSESVPTASATASEPASRPPVRDRLRLKDVRAAFRLVNDVRELGADPQKWRPHMVRQLATLLRATI